MPLPIYFCNFSSWIFVYALPRAVGPSRVRSSLPFLRCYFSASREQSFGRDDQLLKELSSPPSTTTFFLPDRKSRRELSAKVNSVKASGTARPFAAGSKVQSTGSAIQVSKLTYRSLLAGIIQPEYIRNLCSVLVVQSGQAKTFDDRRLQEEKAAGREDQNKDRHALFGENNDDSQNMQDGPNISADACSNGTDVDKIIENSGSNICCIQKDGRPMSPGTLALMCDEPDLNFISSQNSRKRPRTTCEENFTEIYAKQERIALMKLRDSLYELANCARMKEENILMAMRFKNSNYQIPALNKAKSCSEEPDSDRAKSINQESVADKSNLNKKELIEEKKQTYQPEVAINKGNSALMTSAVNSCGSIQKEILSQLELAKSGASF